MATDFLAAGKTLPQVRAALCDELARRGDEVKIDGTSRAESQQQAPSSSWGKVVDRINGRG